MGLFTEYSDEYYWLKDECDKYDDIVENLTNRLSSIKSNLQGLDDALKRYKYSYLSYYNVLGRPKKVYNSFHEEKYQLITNKIKLYKEARNNIKAQLDMAKQIRNSYKKQKNSEKIRCEREDD